MAAEKSSFAKAGLLPRLKRGSDRWLTLPVFRPLNDPLRELALVLARAFTEVGSERSWRQVCDELLSPGEPGGNLIKPATDLREAAGRPEVTVLLTIDQFEELSNAAEDARAVEFLQLLSQALQASPRPVMALATMRSDFLSDFQRDPRLAGLPYEAMPTGPPVTKRLRARDRGSGGAGRPDHRIRLDPGVG